MKNKTLFIASLLLIGMPSFMCAHTDVLKPWHDKINKDFINQPSKLVAKRVRKGKHLSYEFQIFVDTSEETNLIKQAYEDPTGKFSLEVMNAKNHLLHDFEKKRNELRDEYKASCQNETWAKIGFTVGTLATGAGVCMLLFKGRNDQSLGIGLSTGGLALDIISGYVWYRSVETQKEKDIHRTEVIKIEEKLDHTFEVLRKKYELQIVPAQ